MTQITTELTLKEKQRNEAIKRLKALKVMGQVVDAFAKNGTVYYSERQNAIFDAILYFVSNKPEFVKIINDFEKETDALVYHAQLMRFHFGLCLSLLFVSNDETQWQQDNDDLQNYGEQLVYVANLTDPLLSESSYIGIISKNGGVSRTY